MAPWHNFYFVGWIPAFIYLVLHFSKPDIVRINTGKSTELFWHKKEISLHNFLLQSVLDNLLSQVPEW